MAEFSKGEGSSTDLNADIVQDRLTKRPLQGQEGMLRQDIKFQQRALHVREVASR